jgi:MFS family permease
MATLGFQLKLLAAEPAAGPWLLPVASLTGVLLAARNLASMMMTPTSGFLLDRLDDRRIVAASGVLAVLAGVIVLIGGRGVTAVVAGCCWSRSVRAPRNQRWSCGRVMAPRRMCAAW